MAAKKNSFEENLKELETLISELESGNAPLDECIGMFEKGVKLSDECLKMIDDAQQKITLLTQKGEAEYIADVKDE